MYVNQDYVKIGFQVTNESLEVVGELFKVEIYINLIKGKKRKTINKKINSCDLKCRAEEYLKFNGFYKNNHISTETIEVLMESYGFKKGYDLKITKYPFYNIRKCKLTSN